MAVRKTETSHRNSGLEANKSFPNLTFFPLRASFVVVDARISDESSFWTEIIITPMRLWHFHESIDCDDDVVKEASVTILKSALVAVREL